MEKALPFAGEELRGFTLALEACPSGMLLVDEEGTIAYANQEAQGQFRASPALPLVGQSVDLLVPQEIATQHHALRQSFLSSATRRAMGTGRDLMARRRDGTLFPVEIGLNPFVSQGQTWVVCSVVDITQRRALLRANEEAQAQAMEAHRLESLGLLAGGVAHDFNNLLGSVLGNASLARTMSKDVGVLECLDDIVLASEQAAALARQMLAYSGRGTFVVKPIDLSKQVMEMSALLRTVVPRSIQLDFSCPEGLPPTQADTSQIRQIVLNLVTNAAEAIGSKTAGSIRLATGRVSADRAYLRSVLPTGLEPGEYLFLEVSDTGQGMEQEVASRVFEPFFTTKDHGHGLGMAATMGIIRAHQGGVFLYTEPGRGTTLKVLLPADGAAESEPEPTRLSILVADDNPGVRRFLARALKASGYHVLEVQDGYEALRSFREQGHRVACAILDVSMPVLSGPEALAEIRKVDARLPVLLTSGFPDSGTGELIREDPCTDFLAKPFTMDGLLAALESALEKRTG